MLRQLAPVLLLLLALPPALARSWELVWEDDFDGTQLDLSKWEAQIGDGCPSLCGWGNNELQYYRSQNATVSGGFLTITAKAEIFGGKAYTSARLRTRDKGDWTRGRFEMRAKMPIGQGIWPAFWMLPTDNVYGTWAASGEIDIMEYLGHQPDRVSGTIHYGGPAPANQYSSSSTTLPSGTFHDAFHVFALEWDECAMRWYVDGTLYATKKDWWSEGGPYPAPFDERFHLLLNVAVGGNLPGPPDGTTQFPQEMVVDYVRVYQEPGVDLGACRQLFDGMEHANPFGNGWFSFGGTVGGGGINANLVDVPPVDGCAASLDSGWGSGGTPGFYGGFGRTNRLDLSALTHFSFWIDPDPGQDYTLEINLQDDDNGDDFIPGTPDGADDEFQYAAVVSPTGPDAVSGGGWQRVTIPLADFTDDNSFHWGGNGVLDAVSTGSGGNGRMINVVFAVIGNDGSSATFRTDQWELTRRTASIGGRVWDDTDGDGTADAGEPGLNGVTVELFDPSLGAVVATRATAGDGDYFFDELLGGDVEVRVDPATLPGGVSPTFDPDGIASASRFALALECDQAVAGQSFGYGLLGTDVAVVSGNGDGGLLRSAPNPFAPRTSIEFDLPREGPVELTVFDVTGRRIRDLVSGRTLPAGRHRVEWDARDDAGAPAAAGVYFYRLRTTDGDRVRRMVRVP
jgi:beta-glucanase (GH16 family)